MSDLITAWVDEAEVKRLAAALLSTTGLPEVEIRYGDSFEGFADGIPAPPPHSTSDPIAKEAANTLRRAREEALSGGSLRPSSSSTPAPTSPPVQSPFRRVTPHSDHPAPPPLSINVVNPPTPNGNDPLLKRLKLFGVWLKGPVGARSYFIATRTGQLLLDEVKNPKLVQVARTLAGASRVGTSTHPEVGSLHVRIGENSILEVVPASSQYGPLILGLLVERSLPEALTRLISTGLQEVADARLIRP